MNRLVLIDGHAILHRAYHALPPLTTSKGELVNAVFGFTSMLLKVRDELKPAYFAVAFDLPKPTFRHQLFANYQIQRPQMAGELSGQIEKVKEVIRTLGIPIYEKEGFEADDVIGTLAKQATAGALEKGNPQLPIEVIIVTGDRDLLQLVDKKTKVYMLIKGLTEATIFDVAKVEEKYDLRPRQIPDYKALIGDPSDNYLGIAGIGPKTAVSLLQKYGSFKGIYQHLTEIPEKIAQKLKTGKESGELSYKLATIRRDAPAGLDLAQCQVKSFNTPAVRKLLEELEFKSLIPRLAGKAKEEQARAKVEQDKEDEGNGQMGLF